MGALAELLGEAVPAPLAVDAERGWMVLADFGEELGWEAPVEVVEDVARAFARLQVRAAAHVDRLLAAGCLDLPTIRRGTAFAEEDGGDDELRRRVGDAYLAEWTSFEPPGRLARAWELALPLGALHQAVSYRSIMARLEPPVDLHMAQSTAWWLRRVLADLG
jgi:hypothetical protein